MAGGETELKVWIVLGRFLRLGGVNHRVDICMDPHDSYKVLARVCICQGIVQLNICVRNTRRFRESDFSTG